MALIESEIFRTNLKYGFSQDQLIVETHFNAVIELVVGDQGHSLYAHAAILRRCSPGLYRLTKKTENGIIRLPDDKLIVVDNFLTWAYYDRITPSMHASADSLDALIDLCIFAERVSADDLRDSIMEVLSQIQGSITMIPVETCTYVWARTLYTSPLRRFLKDWWKKYGRMDQVTQELLERIPDLAAWLLRSFMKDRQPQAQMDTSEIGPSQIAGVKKSKDKWSRRISGTPHST
ncbi:BTB/POZ domain-containing protein 8 [Elsinoe australis]|uniref:BTB/POZ domain-containing protein 8 n=1 Tax=Elsinoe australis TaxID=40998 RepID=A0A4U7B5M8_9PEZI|nr:BTB/POZ domain-containing protein 8 [Elsinoe australis]